MSTTIYDSSLLTQRRMNKAESVSFQRRIQSKTNPTTGYAPALGIYDQSVVNTVKNGNMTYYRKSDGGCTLIDPGAPCDKITPDPSIQTSIQPE